MARVEDFTGRKVLLEASGLKKGHILDVGIGECACMSFFLARQGFDVTGIDRSPMAIHVARRDAASKHIKGTFQARLADAAHLPFDDTAFDAVVSYHSLHHMDHPERVVREMFRVCKPGGVVMIAELNETGRKHYSHDPDHDGFLKRIKRCVRTRSAVVGVTHTRLDMLFVCRKNVGGKVKTVKIREL